MTASKDQANSSATDALDTVYRDLVGIHASTNEALGNDPNTIMPWTEGQLRDVLDSIKKHQAEQRPANTERQMLDVVYDRLDMIRAAIEARTDDDRDIVPWSVWNIMGLLREIDAFRLGAGR